MAATPPCWTLLFEGVAGPARFLIPAEGRVARETLSEASRESSFATLRSVFWHRH